MKVIYDVEANGLLDTVSRIWCVVCIDVDTGTVYRFGGPDMTAWVGEFLDFAEGVTQWIGHNVIGYDNVVIERFTGLTVPKDKVLDTLILSRLIKAQRSKGHSLDAWGVYLKYPKWEFDEWHRYSNDMMEYCVNDVKLNLLVYQHLMRWFSDEDTWAKAVSIEHYLAEACTQMNEDGFSFDIDTARSMHEELVVQVNLLTEQLQKDFPPRARLLDVRKPRVKKDGSLSLVGLKSFTTETDFSPDSWFSRVEWVPFNPGSPRQVVSRLNSLGWAPMEKTKGHLKLEQEIKLQRRKPSEEQLTKLKHFEEYGWKVTEQNLGTIPSFDEQERFIDTCRIRLPKQDVSTNVLTMLGIENERKSRQDEYTIRTQDVIKTPGYKELTEFLLRIMNEWFPKSKDIVKSAILNHLPFTSITVTPTDMYVDFSATDVMDILGGMSEMQELLKSISRNKSARNLVMWLLLDSRRSTLEEWMKAYNPGTRTINGSFMHIGSWTHRMSHNNPNMANIPAVKADRFKNEELKQTTLRYGKQMRSLWRVDNEDTDWLVGCDAEGIQLRILAHYINDPAFTEALTQGSKEDATDAHSLNMRALGDVCRSRDNAKTFIYAFLLGAGTAKIAQIFGCSVPLAKQARDSFIEAYPGLQHLKNVVIPEDARRGYFTGLDGRLVTCNSEHLMLAGYLQNGEKVVMSNSLRVWQQECQRLGIGYTLRNFVHDEFQSTIKGTRDDAEALGALQADSFSIVGRQLGLNCPLAGSYEIGKNWYDTH